ncbi:MAG: phycobilisome rod-core linker polypeptide [Prochloraceae cyanobacterium]
MVNTFINPVIGTASQLGVSFFEETEAIELQPGFSESDIETVIRAVYRQVLGNIHLMESERLTIAESQLKGGEITVREFVRQVAKSELYSSRFFFNCPRYRAIELNFKHLLGRAPESYEEMQYHSQLLDEGGFEAEIDSYLDSDEYELAFGENVVPYYQGYKTQTGKNVIGFTHLFQILRGSCSSDRSSFAGIGSRLKKYILSNTPSAMIPLSSPPPYQPASQPLTDVNKLLSKVLGIKSQPVSTFKQADSSFINVLEQEQLALQRQYQSFEDTSPIELIAGRSEEEIETVIRAVYRQVLGNAYVMESERLRVPESQIKLGEISVREFVRQVAKSELYRSRFFENCPRYRSIELNFKHLLGRAPHDYSETFYHSQVLDQGGFEAEIDSYIDSDEYQDAFGENVVPFNRGYKTQTGKKLLGFTNMFKLLPSLSTSDKSGLSGNQPRLTEPLIYNNPGGKAPVTDIDKLLAEVFKPKPIEQPTVAKQLYTKAYQELQRECEEQENTIKTLKQQLAELQPFATIGVRELNKWQSKSSATNGESQLPPSLLTQSSTTQTFTPTDTYQDLQRRSEQQKQDITALREKIADLRRFATIGEARLNKWRTRTFS